MFREDGEDKSGQGWVVVKVSTFYSIKIHLHLYLHHLFQCSSVMGVRYRDTVTGHDNTVSTMSETQDTYAHPHPPYHRFLESKNLESSLGYLTLI